MQHPRRSLLSYTLPVASGANLVLVALSCIALSDSGRAQIVPDRALGAESTVVTPDIIKGIPSDRIDEGAIRGTNLFHSFQEFNVNSGRGAYFSNPAGIENILSRVTGGNASQILGTLGVLGNANLFLINPNGIVFGPNARLDVAGSFFASTADRLVFDRGLEFSATNPQAPPLLTVNIPIGLQYRHNQLGAITNAGKLIAGQNLTLLAGNLDLQGQLSAGEDLTLLATDTLRVRDAIANPFVAAAGGQLLIQGNQTVDIFALNHPNSELFSGGDMVLRSANPVVGDAHYWSRGSFRIEQLDGSLGNLFSFYDPVIRSLGNVNFDSYQGASLHILAAGKVEIPGEVSIIASDPANGLRETVTLSDGTPVLIDGQSQLTFDIRAGMNQAAVGKPLLIGNGSGTFLDSFSNSLPSLNTIASTAISAEVSIGNIFTDSVSKDGGRVLITNQYQPNSSLSGGITVGSIKTNDVFGGGIAIIDSRDSITLNGTVEVSSGEFDVYGSPLSDIFGNGGDVILLANNDITLNSGSNIFSDGLLGGNITLKSNAVISGTELLIESRSFTPVAGTTGGDIKVMARSLSLTNGALLSVSTLREGNAGSVTITASENVLLDGVGSNHSSSGASSQARSGSRGNAGDIKITTGSVSVTNGARLSTSTFGQGDAGSVIVNASKNVLLNGEDINAFRPSPSGVFSQANDGDVGNAGDIKITARSLWVTNGAQLSTSTFGDGNGGELTVTAESVQVIGTSSKKAIDDSGRVASIPSRLSSETVPDSTSDEALESSGDGGRLTIKTGRLRVTDGAEISTNTFFGSGDGGSLTVNASESVQLIGGGRLSTNTSGAGNAGNLTVSTRQLLVQDGAQATVSSTGTGNAGNLEVEARDILLDNQGIISSDTTSGQGNITLRHRDLIMRRNSLISTNAPQGNAKAGNITIETDNLVGLENSDITANANKGAGGFIQIMAQAVFGLERREKLTQLSDITAISQQNPELNGVVEINTSEVSPNSGLIELPENIVDPAALVAQNPCARGSESEFIITGRGGVPASPSEALSSEATRVGLVEPVPMGSREVQERSNTPSTPKVITPAQGWVFNALDEVVLTAYNPSVTGHQRLQRNSGSCPAL